MASHLRTFALLLQVSIPTAMSTPTLVFRLSALLLLLIMINQLSARSLEPVYVYRIRPLRAAQQAEISLELPRQSGRTTRLAIPAWRPGRYILQNYAAAIYDFQAVDAETGTPLPVTKYDKDSWTVNHSKGLKRIRVSYRAVLRTLDAGSSMVREDLVYLNPSNFLAYVPGKLEEPCTVELLDMPANWMTGTALPPTDKPNTFRAANYHEAIDCPIVSAPQQRHLEFMLQGARFHVWFQGDYQATEDDERAFLSNTKAILLEQAAIAGGFPFKEYHFQFVLAPFNIRHAVEHATSALFVVPANQTEPGKKLAGLLSIVAHEFWHVWNVKRLRPAALWPYDYSREQNTALHWFTEGVTDYYTDLTFIRAGLFTEENFLKQMASELAQIDNLPANRYISPAQASRESWLATSPYLPAQLRTSYYPLGSKVGLLLDLQLRANTQGRVSLDEVFRYLYRTYYQQGKGVPENGIQRACETLTGSSWRQWFLRYVEGTEAPNYAELFAKFGVRFTDQPDTDLKPSTRLGFTRASTTPDGILLDQVRWHSDAAQAGLLDGDLILIANGKTVGSTALDDVLAGAQPGQQWQLTVLREGGEREITLRFSGERELRKYTLTATEPSALRAAWLKGGR